MFEHECCCTADVPAPQLRVGDSWSAPNNMKLLVWGIENINLRYNSHAQQRFCEKFSFAKYPVIMTAMSGSLLGTNAHYKVKIGLLSLSHKIITRVRAHYRFTCCTEARAAEGCYAPESFEGEGACSTWTRQPASLRIHFQLFNSRVQPEMCARSPLLFIHAREHPSPIFRGAEQQREQKHPAVPLARICVLKNCLWFY